MKNNSDSTNNLSRKYVNILGINVISTNKREVLTRVKEFISHNDKFYITTPNPELILMAQDNIELKASLNSSNLPIPDGIGLKLSDRKLKIIKGRQLFMDLIDMANENRWKVFFLGGMANEAELAGQKIKEIYKNIKIETFAGPILNTSGDPVTKMDRKIYFDSIRKINDFSPHLLFVAMENPRQEIFIYRNLSKLKIGGAMTVGGTFRYISGISKLPPKIFEAIGLEWLWRLITEPRRFNRIMNAVVLFPLKVLIAKVKTS